MITSSRTRPPARWRLPKSAVELQRGAAALALATLLLCGCDPRPAAAEGAAAAATTAYTHVKTFATIGAEHTQRDAANYEYGIQTSYAQAASWVTWAATDDRFAKAIHAHGMKTTFYADPHRISRGGFPMRDAIPTAETAYFHTCDGRRVQTSFDGSVAQYVGDPASPALASYFNDYIDERMRATGGSYDAVWEDDAGPLSEFYQPFSAPFASCWYPGDVKYNAAQRAFDARSHLPVIFENLANHRGLKMSSSVDLIDTPNVIAGLLEYCFAFGSEGRAKEFGADWKTEENTAIAVTARAHRMLFCFNYPSSAETPTAIDARGYILASFLLTFDPERSVLAEQAGGPSGLTVEPEAALVPLQPAIPTPVDIDGLRTSSGAYAREYRACYEAGTLAGPCAIVVNPNRFPVLFPYRGYTRTMTISGRGIVPGLDDGRIGFGGPPGLVLPAQGWAIAFR
jgi:hypothetical protein